jgi:hypothetical protein
MASIIIAPLVIALLCIAFYVYSRHEALRWAVEYVEPRVQATEAYYRRPITPVLFASRKFYLHADFGRLIIGLAAEEIEEASEEHLSEEEEVATIPRQPSVRFVEPILPPPATAYIRR